MSRFVLTAQLQLQAPTNVGQVVQQIQNQLNNVRVNVQVQGAPQAQRQLNQVTNATNQATNAANALGRSFGLSIKRFAAFSIATRAVSLFTSTLSNAVKEAIDFERELIKISQVTGKSIGQLRDLTNEITRLSTSLGVGSTSLLSVSRILSQAGLNADETRIALDALAKSELAPTFDDIQQTAEGVVAVFNQFQQGAAALEAQLGSINAVAGQFAVEAGDLISVVRRTGGVFKAAGGDLNELIALFTSVRATTRESAESIATGLRTIFTRIQRPQTIEFLRQYGVELLDLEGKFVGPFEATRRLSEALAGLEQGDITFIKIAEELGGFRQIGKVIPLLQQFSVAQEALNVAQKGSGSLAEDAAKAQLSLAVRITKVKEEFLALVRSISESKSFQLFANTALNLASALIKLADALKPVIPLLTAFAAIKLATGVGSFVRGIGGGLRTPRAFASGGLVPGSGNRDTVPAMLTPGEFVIRKSSVAKLGAGNLAAMNENRYAGGTPLKGVPKPKPKSAVQKGKQVGGVGIFDSDKIPGGTNVKKALLEQLRASKKPYQVISGPAGSGKTTFAAGRFGANFVLTPADLQKYSRFVVLSGAGKTKSGDFSDDVKGLLSGASGITVLNPGADRLMQQRQGRVDAAMSGNLPDQRSVGALQGTMRAPTDSNLDLFRGYGNVNVLDRYAAGGEVVLRVRPNKFGGMFLSPPTEGDSTINSPQGRTVSPTYSRSLIEKLQKSGQLGGLGAGTLLQTGEKRTVPGQPGMETRRPVSLVPNSEGAVPGVYNTTNQSRRFGNVVPTAGFREFLKENKIRQASSKDGVSLNNPKIKALLNLYTGNARKTANLPNKIANVKIAADSGSIPALVANTADMNVGLQDEVTQIAYTGMKNMVSSVLNSSTLSSKIGPERLKKIRPNIKKSVAKLFNDDPKGKVNSARAAIEGYLFEGIIGGITGKFPESSGALFDFMYPGRGDAEGWTDLFGPQGAAKISLLTAADAKRSASSGNKEAIVDKVGKYLATAINPGLLSQFVTADPIVKKALGGLIQKFATGGAVGTDTVPALLTPGEFVINRSSAQKIGYGSLNRMNKVGKYAKGGVVQHFASGTTGSGAKPKGGGGFFAFDTSPIIKDLKAVSNKLGFFQTSLQQAATNIQQIANVSPAYASALQNSAVFTKLSGDKQKEITDKITNKITALQKSGESEEKVKKALDDYSKNINQQSKTALGKEKKAALQKAGFTPKSVKQALITGGTADETGTVIPNETGKRARRGANAAYRSSLEKERMPGETLKATETRLGPARQTELKQKAVNIGNREASVGIQKAQRLAQQEAQNLARSLNQASTSANQSAAADNMGAQASKNAAMGDNLDAQASKNAAQADQLEANASKAASGKVSPGGGGMMGGGGGKGGGGKGGGMMGGGGGMDKALGLTMAAASLQAFLPPLDESSSALMKLTHNTLSAVTMLGSLMLVVQTLLPNLTLAHAGMFLTGKAGTLVAGKLSFLGATASSTAGALATIAGPLIAVVGGFFLVNTALKSVADAYFNFSADLKAAQKAGNAEKAGQIAAAQANTNKALIVVSALLTAALTAAAFSAGLLSAPLALITVAIMAAVAAFMFFASESSEAAKTHAAAVAEQVNVQKALTQANKDATEAMKQFEEGTISAFDAVASTAAAGDAISKLQRRNNEADQAVANQSGLQRFWNQSSQAEAKAQRDEELKKSEEEFVKTNEPAMKALSRQIAATGGDFAQFQEQLKLANPGLYAILLKNGFTETEKAFDNIKKEAERTRKAFDAMNLGFQGVAAVAGALTVTMDNYLASQEAGYIGLNNTIAMLEASITSAAQGISDADFNAALGSASNGLRKLGASQGDIEKFEQNLGAINTAQKFFAKASEETRNELKAELERGAKGTGGLTRSKFAEILAGQLDGVAPEVRDRIKDALENADIDPKDMEKLLEGDLSVLDKVLKDLGDTTLNQVIGPLKELAKYEQQLVNLAQKRYDAENKVIEAAKNLVEAQMEAAEIIAKYGGAAFTPEMRAQGVLAQANIEGQAAGVTPLVTGSAAEFNARSAQIRQGLAGIGGVQAAAAGNNAFAQQQLEGRSGAALAEQQKRLINLAKTEYETAKKLISIKEQELKLIAEKNRLEKSSIEALVTGDISKFFEQQAAVGATASIALGSTRLQSAYGADALGLAAQDIKRQQEAGVTEIYGQQVGGSGGLAERAFGAALSARGVSQGTALGMAQTAAGTTPEEEALKGEIRSLATTLPNYAAIQLQVAEQDLQVANIQMMAAEMQLEAAKRQMQQRARPAGAAGGGNPNNPPNPNAPNANNAPGARIDPDMEVLKNGLTGAALGGLAGLALGSFMGMPLLGAGIGALAGGEAGMFFGSYAKGGTVYANNGMFVPKGTDTVPAMLTPGEFVVRRAAVQRGNNLAILKAMNKGQSGVSTSGALSMANGGVVYADRGGLFRGGRGGNQPVQSSGSIGINPETVNKLSETLTQFNSSFGSFTTALSTFNSTLSANIDRLNNTTFNVKLDTTNVNVNLNGGSFLAKLKDDIRNDLLTEVAQQISNYSVGQDGKLKKNSGPLTT